MRRKKERKKGEKRKKEVKSRISESIGREGED